MSLKNKIQENINSLTPLGRYLFTCILVVLPYFILYAICNVLAKYHIFDTITTFFDTHQLFIIILALLAFIIACIFIDSDKWHKCKSFARDNALIVVLLLLYIFFYRFWEGLIRDYIIDKFLCNYESNLLSIFIICLACLGLVWLEGNRLGKRISPRKKLIYISALCFWVYYRWICNQFGPEKTSCQLSFVSLLNNGYLKYIDIVPFIALCEILPSVFAKEEDESYYVRRNQGETTGYITDNPIKKNDDDILKRDSFVTSAIQELLKTDIVDGAYTFGINSPWGAGKTSFINLMKEQIQNPYSGYNSNSILIDFNPWLYATEKDLVSAFFDELSKYLKQYDLSLAKDIIDYSKLLSAFGTKETKLIASLIELTKNDPSTLQKKKDRITNTLRRIKKPIFVFVDDLDRLDADELMEMMKLIRNISDFPYIYFIAAYDKAYLVECLEKRMNFKGADFVEKIFQHEFHLPPSPSEKLRNTLCGLIVNSEEVKKHEQDRQLLEQYIRDNKNPLSALSNLREVKRLANHFNASYRYVTNEINVIDLLLIELIKTKYPLVFAFFQRKKDAILETTGSNHQLYQLYKGKNDFNHIDFINYIQIHREEFKLNDIDKLYIEAIFRELFPLHIQSKDSKKINEITWFNRYINLTELESDISTIEFENALKEDAKTLHDSMDEWISVHKSYALRSHILNHNSQNRDEHLKLIDAAFYFMSKDKEIEVTDIDTLIRKLNRFNQNESLTDEDRKYIIDILLEYGFSSNTRKYIGSLYYYNYKSRYFITYQDIVAIQQKILQNLINISKNDSSITPRDIYHSFCELLTSYSFFHEKQYPHINDDLIRIMRVYIKDNIIELLPGIVEWNAPFYGTEPTDPNGEYSLNPIVELIWGSQKRFYNYINTLNDDHPLLSTYHLKEFLEKYEKNDFKATPFRFEDFPDKWL